MLWESPVEQVCLAVDEVDDVLDQGAGELAHRPLDMQQHVQPVLDAAQSELHYSFSCVAGNSAGG